MLLDNLLDLGLLEVRDLVLLHVEDDLGTTSNAGSLGIELDGEAAAGTGFPDVLLIVI